MSRQANCGRREALARAAVAQRYLMLADLAAADDVDASRNAAVGNAVLAGIAAADALCCLRIGARSRSQDHQTAAELLRAVDVPLARDLERLLAQKDVAHYGDRAISTESLAAALRCARRLVDAAREALRG